MDDDDLTEDQIAYLRENAAARRKRWKEHDSMTEDRKMRIPIVARCTKCGRGFLTLPKEWPACDTYSQLGSTGRVCGGALEKVDDPADKRIAG